MVSGDRCSMVWEMFFVLYCHTHSAMLMLSKHWVFKYRFCLPHLKEKLKSASSAHLNFEFLDLKK